MGGCKILKFLCMSPSVRSSGITPLTFYISCCHLIFLQSYNNPFVAGKKFDIFYGKWLVFEPISLSSMYHPPPSTHTYAHHKKKNKKSVQH